MTISNGNMLAGFLTPAESSQGGLLAGQLQASAVNADSGEGLSQEGQFWSIVNQHLTEIVSQEDANIIENKDLLAMFDAFEADLENSDNESGIPSQWMQFLKSHFELEMKNDGSDVIRTDTINESEQEPSSPLLASVFNLNKAANIESESGEKLPIMRQGLSAVMPPEAANIEVESGEKLPIMRQGHSAVMPPEVVRIESAAAHRDIAVQAIGLENQSAKVFNQAGKLSTEDLSAFKAEINFEDALDPALEKNVMKQALAEQINNPSKNEAVMLATKTADVMTTLQANPIASNPLQSPAQTLASQNLPTALQSLQLTPQTPSSEWGNALGERVSFLINNKLNNAEIRIDPPHLGKLDIQIQVKEDSALIVINTQNAQTRDLIDSASIRLREFLQEAGYRSVDVNVSHQDQSMAQDGAAQQGSGGSADSTQGAQSAQSDQTDGLQAEMMIKIDDGRIDYFA